MAKVHGCYLNNRGGFSMETFRDLTGAPTNYINIRYHSKESIW